MGSNQATRKEYLQLCVFLFIPLLLFFKGINGFPFPSAETAYSDLAISHYPNALYLKRALLEWRSIPLWSPTILSGYPFFANPLSGLWYPPGWLALLLPLPLGFNLLVMVHLLWGGLGMYQLLRRDGVGHLAASFGGLAFLSLPKLFAQYGAGHLTLLYAIPWTPWLLLGKIPGIRYQGSGIVLALIFLADPRWAPLAGLLWLGYIFAHRQKGDGFLVSEKSPTSKTQPLVSTIKFLLSNLGISALLGAPLAIPLLEYSQHSTRSALTADDVFAHSMPPARLMGFLFPDFSGFHEWMIYVGGSVIILGIVALIAGLQRPQIKFWGFVFLFSVIISLGSHIPFFGLLANIPGIDLLRVPARALFLVGFAGAALSAYGVDSLLESEIEKNSRWLSLSLVGLSSFCVMLALGVKWITGTWALNFLWGAGVISLASLWILIRPRVWLPPQTWFYGLILIALVDWGVVNSSLLTFRKADQVLSEGRTAAEYMHIQDGPFRIYSPSYSIPQQTAAFFGLELADGVDPLQISNYTQFMDAATGVPGVGYSITLPPFSSGEPATANTGYLPDAKKLGVLNVAFVVAAFDLDIEGLVFTNRYDNLRIYKNEYAYPRAWVQYSTNEPSDEIITIEQLVWEPNRISFQARGPGILVLSEIAYPGWRAEIDGSTAGVEPFMGVLRSVQLPEGEHTVVFSFMPWSLYVGLACFLSGVLVLIFVNRRGVLKSNDPKGTRH